MVRCNPNLTPSVDDGLLINHPVSPQQEAIDKRYITDEDEAGQRTPIEGLGDDDDDDDDDDDEADTQGGIMSLSSQEDVVDDGLSPLRGNLSSPELPSTPVLHFRLRGSGGGGWR